MSSSSQDSLGEENNNIDLGPYGKFVNSINCVNDKKNSINWLFSEALKTLIKDGVSQRYNENIELSNIKFDTVAKNQLYLIQLVIYNSCKENNFGSEYDIKNIPNLFDLETLEYQMWFWIVSVFQDLNLEWNTVIGNEHSKFNAMSLLHTKTFRNDPECQDLDDECVMAQSCLIIITNQLIKVLIDLNHSTYNKKINIKGQMINGCLRIIDRKSFTCNKFYCDLFKIASIIPEYKKSFSKKKSDSESNEMNLNDVKMKNKEA